MARKGSSRNDGNYKKEFQMESIAITITTHNRKEIFESSLEAWKKYLPENAKIFVVQARVKFSYPSESFYNCNNDVYHTLE